MSFLVFLSVLAAIFIFGVFFILFMNGVCVSAEYLLDEIHGLFHKDPYQPPPSDMAFKQFFDEYNKENILK